MHVQRAAILIFVTLFHAGMCLGTPDKTIERTVPSGAMFRVEVTRRARLQKNRAIQGRLLEPVYRENRLVIPRGASLEGFISTVHPASHGKRLEAKFHGDFTSLNEPIIRWNALSQSDGREYTLQAESAGATGTTLYFRSLRAGHPSLFRRIWSTVVGRKDSAVNTVTAPQKMERLQRYFWSQMPYHPQYLEVGSQYEMVLTQELHVPAQSPEGQATLDLQKPLERLISVHSRLRSNLDSAKAKPGDAVEGVVTEPVLDAQNQLIIPQNSILHGTVLRAIPARRWGRNGILRFSFDDITSPSGFQQKVEATPMAIEASSDTKLEIDQEGGVARQSNRNIAAPLVMGLLAASALGDDDGGLGKDAVSSNGFALIGRLLAIGIGSRYVAGTIGAFGTGRSVYTHWLAHGKDTRFGNDTEVLLEMSPAHAHRMNRVP